MVNLNNTHRMKQSEQKRALGCAMSAACAAGQIMRDNFHAPKKIDSATQHDIKLELDVRCQTRIETMLQRAFPLVAILGEEGVAGNQQADYRWVIDPIDGTVNFTYGIPHACVSIALQIRMQASVSAARPPGPAPHPDAFYQTVVGVVYDPFCDELWTAMRGGPARLNGKLIHASKRRKLTEAIVSIGFAKQKFTMGKMLPALNRLLPRVRKVRMMGAAALSLVYVASGRMDAYLEYGLRLWDIAAGGLILECAGGDFWNEPVSGKHTYQILANNGLLRRSLQRILGNLR